MHSSVALAFAFAVSFVFSPASCVAWSIEGHQAIAELAQRQLSFATSSAVNRLLALEPGASMVSVSGWADEVRSGRTASWHFVNLPADDCRYDRPRDCRDGRCLVEALNEKIRILRSAAADAERLIALKYVIHLIADVHQPLHAGLRSDKGGNQVQVHAFGRGTNLHALWDGALIRRRDGGMAQLLEDASSRGLAAPKRARPEQWAFESCQITHAAGFYPGKRHVDTAYLATWDPVLVARIRAASRRLAATLNEVLQ